MKRMFVSDDIEAIAALLRAAGSNADRRSLHVARHLATLAIERIDAALVETKGGEVAHVAA